MDSQQLASEIPQPSGPLGGAHDVGEHHGGQHPIGWERGGKRSGCGGERGPVRTSSIASRAARAYIAAMASVGHHRPVDLGHERLGILGGSQSNRRWRRTWRGVHQDERAGPSRSGGGEEDRSRARVDLGQDGGPLRADRVQDHSQLLSVGFPRRQRIGGRGSEAPVPRVNRSETSEEGGKRRGPPRDVDGLAPVITRWAALRRAPGRRSVLTQPGIPLDAAGGRQRRTVRPRGGGGPPAVRVLVVPQDGEGRLACPDPHLPRSQTPTRPAHPQPDTQGL